jgi:hypothetical protein
MKIVQQRNDHDCMLAAIATVLEKEYDELWTPEFIQKVVDTKGCTHELSNQALSIAGLKEHRDYWNVYTHQATDSTKALLRGRRAILSVNSLNNRHGNHAVVWDGENLLDVSNKTPFKYIGSVVLCTVWIFNEVSQSQAYVAWSTLNSTITKAVDRLKADPA